MKLKLKQRMSYDMKIHKYEGESEVSFLNRLIYSGLAESIRLSVLDRTNSSDNEIKSMVHIRNRGEEILTRFLELYKECIDYYFNENNKNIHPINIIRQRMLNAEELLRIQNGVALPKYKNINICNQYARIMGLYLRECKFVGITKVHKYESNNYINCVEFDSNEMVELIIQGLEWQKNNKEEGFEFFNPRIKDAPNKCWVKKYCMNNEEITLSRIKIQDYLYDYYFVKEVNKQIYIAKLNEHLLEFKEARRIISVLRYRYNNTLFVNAEHKSEVVILKLYSALPLKEQILIETYSWPLNNLSDKYNYVVPTEVWELIKKNLLDMKMQVNEVMYNGRI